MTPDAAIGVIRPHSWVIMTGPTLVDLLRRLQHISVITSGTCRQQAYQHSKEPNSGIAVHTKRTGRHPETERRWLKGRLIIRQTTEHSIGAS
jgi:hypothetical protein